MTEQQHIDTLEGWKRTHDCSGLRADDIGNSITLMGWVNSRRDLGNLIFIDLRDREGITQVVFDPQINETVHEKAHALRGESVVAVKGEVSARLEGQENPDLPTGAIEIKAVELKILNHTETPPFQVDGKVDASETLRLKYRYLELRRKNVFEKIQLRHRIGKNIREYLNARGFMDVETPFLTKSTPEGARDYLVPSRVSKGMFYALPQSPQLFKQLLMVAGFDKYYQIVKCFRDEDLRADRQPEFTQVDLEMSFVNEKDVMDIFEGLMIELFESILGAKVQSPIPHMFYQDAMDRFGTDRPDLRFNMELVDITDLIKDSEFRVFQQALESGGNVKGIRIEKRGNDFSRKALDELTAQVCEWGPKGLLWIKVKDNEWQSPIKKFFDESGQKAINERFSAKPGDLLLIVADQPSVTANALGMLRLEMAKKCDLIKKDDYSFVWVTHFPLLEYDEEAQRHVAVHHPFTAPLEEDMHLLDDQPEKVRARAYDLVLNGVEIGGGSIRIHNLQMQDLMFRKLGISPEEAEMKFGFLLEALKFGAPPHGGMALGFDRLVALMAGVESIREVIAFPKTASASCLMTNAPSGVDEAQLGELGLKPA